MAHYAEGDVYLDLPGIDDRRVMTCDVGMATAAAMYRLHAGIPRALTAAVTVERDMAELTTPADTGLSWSEALSGTATVDLPDARMQFLYDAAVRTVTLLSSGDLVPGPYTYRRFWFRDACLMLHPMIAIGMTGRAGRIIDEFPDRQTAMGYFLSQEGEWDSNGQVLWIVARYAAMTGQQLTPAMNHALRKAVHWLARKRVGPHGPPGTQGLLPAGFSAEHLGPNDFYYWDDFWAWGGLQEIARHWRATGELAAAGEAESLAAEFAASIEASLASIPSTRAKGAMPAAPGRRLDAGAIGSMVADYPLQLYPPGEARLAGTADFLMRRCFHEGGFFQEMIHSGINAYLTLDLAQTLLRAGHPGFAALVRRVADLASPTGQWPEAIHPRTLGGCMGDGQHGWAAAEWIMMIRNCFIREERDHLVLGSGLLPEWIDAGTALRFGPSLTPWGPVSVQMHHDTLTVDARWRASAPRLRLAVPGFQPAEAAPDHPVFPLRRSCKSRSSPTRTSRMSEAWHGPSRPSRTRAASLVTTCAWSPPCSITRSPLPVSCGCRPFRTSTEATFRSGCRCRASFESSWTASSRT